MNLTITITTLNGRDMKDRSVSENAACALVTDEEGKPISITTKYHGRSNAIFVAYKVLFSAINTAYKVGAERIAIQTDMGSLRRELEYGGNGNLYMDYKDRSFPFEITVTDFDIVSDEGSQRALFAMMNAGASLALRSSDRWASL